MIMQIAFSLPGLVLVGCIYTLICNERTYRLRRRILNSMQPGHPDFWPLHNAMDAVDYGAHMREVVMFRDPLKLYSAKIVDNLREYETAGI